MNKEITKYQASLIAYALGLTESQRGRRNYYRADSDSPEFDSFVDLENKGYVVNRRYPGFIEGTYYHVTVEGYKAFEAFENKTS